MTTLLDAIAILCAAGSALWLLCAALVLRELLRVNRERRP